MTASRHHPSPCNQPGAAKQGGFFTAPKRATDSIAILQCWDPHCNRGEEPCPLTMRLWIGQISPNFGKWHHYQSPLLFYIAPNNHSEH